MWLVLDAAGEKNIGADPSIEANNGELLASEQLKNVLKNGTAWVGTNTGSIPGGDKIFIAAWGVLLC